MLPFGNCIRSNGSSRRLVTIGTVEMDRSAEPPVGLVDQAEFAVVDTNRAERAFSEVEDLMPVGRTFAGQQIHLVVAVEVHLVARVAELLALQQLVLDVRVAGQPRRTSGSKSRPDMMPFSTLPAGICPASGRSSARACRLP